MTSAVVEWTDADPTAGVFNRQNLWTHRQLQLASGDIDKWYQQYTTVSFGRELPEAAPDAVDPLAVWIVNGQQNVQQQVQQTLGFTPDLVEYYLFSDQPLGSELPKKERLSLFLVPSYHHSAIFVPDDNHPVFDKSIVLDWVSLGTHPLARAVIDVVLGKARHSVAESFRTGYELAPEEVKLLGEELWIKWTPQTARLIPNLRAWIEETHYLAFNITESELLQVYGLMELAAMFGATVWNNCLLDETMFPELKYLILSSERPEFDAQFFESQWPLLGTGLPIVRVPADFPPEYDHYARLYSATLAYQAVRLVNPALPEEPQMQVFTNYVKVALSHVQEWDIIKSLLKAYRNLVDFVRVSDYKAALYYAHYLRTQKIYPLIQAAGDQWVVIYDNQTLVALPPLVEVPPPGKNDTTQLVPTSDFANFVPTAPPEQAATPTLLLPPLTLALVPTKNGRQVVAEWLVAEVCPVITGDTSEASPEATRLLTRVLGPLDPEAMATTLSLWLAGRLITPWGRCYWSYTSLPSAFTVTAQFWQSEIVGSRSIIANA